MSATFSPEPPVKVADILVKLYKEFGFSPTKVFVGRTWTWRHSSIPEALINITMPVTVHPVFSKDGKQAFLNHESGLLKAVAANYILDLAQSIAHGKPRIAAGTKPKVVFVVDQSVPAAKR